MESLLINLIPAMLSFSVMGSGDPVLNLDNLKSQGVDTSFALAMEQDVKAEATNDKITVKVFTSYECDHCADYSEEVKELRSSAAVDLQYYHFPFTVKNGALAAVCAEAQGKFYEMNDRIFKEQNDLTAEKMQEHAENLELDLEKFQSCFEAEQTLDQVNKEKTEGRSLGVEYVPTTFVADQEKITGEIPLENLEKIIRNYQD
jgi:protein-disulfide isomerase